MKIELEWLKELKTEYDEKEKQLREEYDHVADVLAWLRMALTGMNKRARLEDFETAISELDKLKVFEKYKNYSV